MKQLKTNYIRLFIETTILQIKNFFDDLIKTNSKKCYLIANWLKYYFEYLQTEREFLERKHYKKFKFGQVVRVSFGFNLGHELGGIHYAIVLNKKDSPYSSDIIVVPLSSKHKELPQNDKESRIDIGFELKNAIQNKIDKVAEKMLTYMRNINEKNIKEEDTQRLKKWMELYTKLKNEFDNMSNGTIVLTRQIRFITKMRILAPTTRTDYFDDVIISSNTMQNITNTLYNIIKF